MGDRMNSHSKKYTNNNNNITLIILIISILIILIILAVINLLLLIFVSVLGQMSSIPKKNLKSPYPVAQGPDHHDFCRFL